MSCAIVSSLLLLGVGTPLIHGERSCERQPAAPAAQPADEQSVDIVVVGGGGRRVGSQRAASAGAVSSDDIRSRPLLRTNELAEAVPGLLAVQHSGGGKAAQYLIRGYNLDHGTDFSIALDGVPMNLPSHAHGQGYLDLNGLIPETIDRIEYRKGPYDARDGDFSLVAAASMRTLDRVGRPMLAVQVGSYGYRRVVGVGSGRIGEGDLLVAGELKTNDGVWALPERLRHSSAFAKYTIETPLGTLRASMSDYSAKWRPTEQIPVRAIGTQVPDRFGTLDPYLRGQTQRRIATLAFTSERTDLTLYAQRYVFDLTSNFTFFLADPVRGDELEQAERRWTYGGRAGHRVPLGAEWQLTLGADVRIDRIDDLGLYHTERGRRIGTGSLADVRETALAGYAELRWRPTERVTLLGGGRIDHYRFRSHALAGTAATGAESDTIVTSKAGAGITLAPGVEVYANYGQGFHSNDARGVLAASDPVPGLVKGTGYEVGTRIERGALALTVVRWWTRSAGELVYSGDDGTVEPSGASRRRGWETTMSLVPLRWLSLDAVYATNHARFTDAPGADRIPNALEAAGSLGVTVEARGWVGALRLRYAGPRPLVEDGRVRGAATTIVNLRLARMIGDVEIAADLLNLLDTRRADADYFYASRLPGEPPDGAEGVHSRAVEPRQVRVGVRFTL